MAAVGHDAHARPDRVSTHPLQPRPSSVRGYRGGRMTLATSIDTAREAWAVTCAVLDFWVAAHGSSSGSPATPALLDPQRFTAWSTAVGTLSVDLDAKATGGTLTDEQIAHLIAETADGADADRTHAAATALDVANFAFFITQWRAEAGSAAAPADEIPLVDGQRFPTPEVQWTNLEGLGHPSRPASVSQPEPHGLPHVRTYAPVSLSGTELQVVIDFRHSDLLRSALLDGFSAAACHPHADLGEFTGLGITSFPIRATSADLAVDQVTKALEAGYRMVVLPELSVNDKALKATRKVTAASDRSALVVAGSRHYTADGGRKTNELTALLAGTDERLVHRKLVRSLSASSGPPSVEAIDQPDPLQLRLWQAGTVRLGLLICKDLLDRRVAEHVADLGVNLLVVCAMSPLTDPFVGRVQALLTDAQCAVVVVNGPLEWNGAAADPSSMIARPVAAVEHRVELRHRHLPGVDELRLRPN
jgi:hypothetical protein